MIYRDDDNGRLVYLQEPASAEFWDGVWKAQMLDREAYLSFRDSQWARITEEFLRPEDGAILEGGCGTGQHVAALANAGYETIGIDFAEQTVATLQERVPELDVRLGDVRALPLEDASVAGYWSLGVIEHFWDGYEAILREMARVVRPGGYLFLVFPYVSPGRALFAKSGRYPPLASVDAQDVQRRFFQFALDADRVAEEVEALGFECRERRPVLFQQGFAEEFPGFTRRMTDLYGAELSLPWRVGRRALHEVYSRLLRAFPYSIMLVCRRSGADTKGAAAAG